MRHYYILILSLGFCFLFNTKLNSQNHINVVDKYVNFGFKNAENRIISAIIVHSTFNNSGGEYYDIDLVIKQFQRYNVSSHYVINREGKIFGLVNEKNISYHAGKSTLPNGSTAVNSKSIGIELMCSIDESPTENQIVSLITLVKDIKNRYKIDFVLRHSDIAPDRKTDPWNMNWDDFILRLSR